MVRAVYLVYIDLNVYLSKLFLTKSISISIIMMEHTQPFNSSFRKHRPMACFSLLHCVIQISNLFTPTWMENANAWWGRKWGSDNLDSRSNSGGSSNETGGWRALFSNGVTQPERLPCQTKRHSRGGHTRSHILPSSAVGRLLPRTWYVVVVNGYS